jgi:hypothetical protein
MNIERMGEQKKKEFCNCALHRQRGSPSTRWTPSSHPSSYSAYPRIWWCVYILNCLWCVYNCSTSRQAPKTKCLMSSRTQLQIRRLSVPLPSPRTQFSNNVVHPAILLLTKKTRNNFPYTFWRLFSFFFLSLCWNYQFYFVLSCYTIRLKQIE